MSTSKLKVAANKAMEYISAKQLPFSTANIAIWQNYFLGENKALIARIRTLQKSGQVFDEKLSSMLYEEYILRNHMREKMGLDQVALDMIEKSEALQTHIHTFCQNLLEKKQSLQDLKRDLSMAEVKEVINLILRQALQEMDEIEQEAQETTLWLDKGMASLQQARNLALEFEMNIHRDFLTGVPDHEYFIKQMKDLLDKSFSGLVKRRKFVVFYISQLDHYNETYSWLLGDGVIRHVTRLIQDVMADYDGWQLMRYSGAGFVVMPIASAPLSSLGIFIQNVIRRVDQKSLIIKSTQQKIKKIDLCALLVPYEVYDGLDEVEARIEQGIDLFKSSGAKGSVVIDLAEPNPIKQLEQPLEKQDADHSNVG